MARRGAGGCGDLRSVRRRGRGGAPGRDPGEVAASYEDSWSVGKHFHPREGAEMLVARSGSRAGAGGGGRGVPDRGTRRQWSSRPRSGPASRRCRARGSAWASSATSASPAARFCASFLDREGLLAYFSGWAFSDEVGHYKPAPQIFEAALAALDAEPAAAMHVGDLRRTDIAGAAALGMRTVRYRALHDDPEIDGGESRRTSSSTATAICPSSSIALKIDPDSFGPPTFKRWRNGKRGPCGASSCWWLWLGSFLPLPI